MACTRVRVREDNEIPCRCDLTGGALRWEGNPLVSKFGKYGEEQGAWTADDAKGFIKILGNANNVYSHKNKGIL